MVDKYVPYEALAREETRDITRHVPPSLGGLTSEELVSVDELIADAYGRGLQAGFDISEFSGDNPATIMEVFNAGITQGRIERGEI